MGSGMPKPQSAMVGGVGAWYAWIDQIVLCCGCKQFCGSLCGYVVVMNMKSWNGRKRSQ